MKNEVTHATAIAAKYLINKMANRVISRLTKKAEPPPTRDVNRDSGTDSANGGWLRRLVRPHGHSGKLGIKDVMHNVNNSEPAMFKVSSDLSLIIPRPSRAKRITSSNKIAAAKTNVSINALLSV